MDSKFLFIGELADQAWIRLLESAVDPFGKLEFVSMQALDTIDWEPFCLAFLDAAGTDDLRKTIEDLHRRNPAMHVVIVTHSPTWSRALEAKNAGASGYIPRFISKTELSEKIREILRSPVAPLRKDG